MPRLRDRQDRSPADCSVVFEAGSPPRNGRLALWRIDSSPPSEEAGEMADREAVALGDTGPLIRPVRAVLVPVGQALPGLLGAYRDADGTGATPSARFWGAAATLALHLVACARILPGVSDDGYDAWRPGPLSVDDVERIRSLAAAMPTEARAFSVPGRRPLSLYDAEYLLRGFLGAVADSLPRTPAAPLVAGGPRFAHTAPQPADELRDWARDLAVGLDSGVRISLRLEIPGGAAALETGAGSAPVRAVVVARSLADQTLVTDAVNLWEGDEGFGPHARFDAIMAVQRAADEWKPIRRLLDQTVPDELELADDEVLAILGEDAPRLEAAGVDVQWPDEVSRDLTARVDVGGDRPPPGGVRKLLAGDDPVSLRWRLVVEGEPLGEDDMDLAARLDRPFGRFRGVWAPLPPAMGHRARNRDLQPLAPLEALGLALVGSVEVAGERVPAAPAPWLADLRDRIANPEGGDEPTVQPPALEATLRDYQLRGLRWLVRMTSLGLGCCLADDMGLGKTVTVIALHLARQAEAASCGPCLVVCPASLLGNWEREITRFAPGTPVRRYHGAHRTLAGVTEGVVLTTYGTMRLDAEHLAGVDWGLVVADEAQHVKNPRSGTARQLRAVPSRARVALTGTPVENDLSELWAILDWATPGLLGSLGEFRTRWARPIEDERDRETARRLARLVGPFLLRRRKSDPSIAPELPAKTETDRPVVLTAEQAALYDEAVDSIMARIAGSEGIARHGLVLKLLTALKQICNHPAHYRKEPTVGARGRSGKLDLLDELLETVIAENESVLVFTQYVEMARLLVDHLDRRGVATQLLHGGTPVPRREEMVRRFQDGEVPIFVLSLKAAGTGLNLTRAGHVLHFDRWWNPAVEDQATDRAYRIGQTRAVQVHRIVAEGTLEERIAEMMHSKREVAESVLSAGEGALSELSDEELVDLVRLRKAGR